MRFYSRCISPHLSPRIYSSVLPRRPTPSLPTLPVCSSTPLQKFFTSRPHLSKQSNESTPSNQSAASGKTPSTNGATSSSGGDAAAAAAAATTGPTKGKPARTMTAKNSLRRVAIIAQQPKRIKKPTTPSPSTITSTTSTDTSAAKEPPTVASAVCMAETFSMPTVLDILTTHGFQIDPDSTGFDLHEVVHARGVSGDGDIFVFPSGTLVTWSLAPDVVSRQLLRAAVDVHPPHLREAEDLDFVVDPDRENSFLRTGDDVIVLGTRRENRDADRRDTTLAKIAFSSGLARSTKLAVLETALTSYFESTRRVPPLLSQGAGVPLSRRFILQKTGELLSLRARLNHYSELTDALPDIFWDSRSELGLEGYYEQVGRALDVNVRIRALNQKMDYAQEIASVLRELSSEQHNTRLEWIIILLIAVEVVFELRREWQWYQKREVD